MESFVWKEREGEYGTRNTFVDGGLDRESGQ